MTGRRLGVFWMKWRDPSGRQHHERETKTILNPVERTNRFELLPAWVKQASRTRGNVCRQSKHWPDASTHTQKLSEEEKKRGRKVLWRKKKKTLYIVVCPKRDVVPLWDFHWPNFLNPLGDNNREKEVTERTARRNVSQMQQIDFQVQQQQHNWCFGVLSHPFFIWEKEKKEGNNKQQHPRHSRREKQPKEFVVVAKGTRRH